MLNLRELNQNLNSKGIRMLIGNEWTNWFYLNEFTQNKNIHKLFI
jgi:hypothetical protein